MKKQFLAASLLLACTASLASAQDNKAPRILDAKPMYKTLPARPAKASANVSTPLVQWNGSFTDKTKQKITYTMVGTNPATTNASSTIPVILVPIKMVYGTTNGNRTFDPKTHKVSNGQSIVLNTTNSPIFQSTVDFNQGGTDLGTTQYIDAFQRANFWRSVKTHTGYHVLLGQPTVAAEKTIHVTAAQGGVFSNPFGSGVVGTMDINAFDAKLQAYMTAITAVNPGVLPLFITYNIYLTQGGGCCIGGYHSANGAQPGGQTYSYATYVDSPGAFSQDVSALSHEIGEWMDDPFVDNNVNCQDNSILEVGDPLEGNSNYGAYPYTTNGFTYNLQSLVFLGYFGAPRTTSVHSWLAFQNDEASVCPGQ